MMDYVTPEKVVSNLADAAAVKARLSVKDMLVRGAMSGALLAVSATLAFQTQIQMNSPVAGGIIFPIGFVVIILLGLELVTGNFAVVPLGLFSGKITAAELARNWGWVFAGNLIGGGLYALLFLATTHAGTPVADRLVALASAKTVAYQHEGWTGMKELFFKAMLCNWLVCLGVFMAATSTSTTGKIVAMWLPITCFFAQGFEHSVVNMFVIPAGMLFGAHVSIEQWWVWNQIPVTLGNIAGGLLFTGMAMYVTHGNLARRTVTETAPAVPQTMPEGLGRAVPELG
jgi:formate/nitrite transporter